MTFYKHLNAGLFIGYASAILDMAYEMQLHKPYHPPEYYNDNNNFHNSDNKSKNTTTTTTTTMSDFRVDDDEWQLSVWFLNEYHANKKKNTKSAPRAILDVHQQLFATTGTFRASHRGDGFLLFSQTDFVQMFGPLPTTTQLLRREKYSWW